MTDHSDNSPSVEHIRHVYADWAASYDDDMAGWGYATPGRIAMALRRAGANVDKGVLDFGCGTGLCGRTLRAVGFDVIDGTDISSQMLAQAEARGCYRSVWLSEPGTLGHIGPGDYAAIVACSAFGSDAAPPMMLDTLVAAMAPGNLFAFSFDDETLSDRAYTDRLDIITLAPDIDVVFEEDGPHLPAQGMNATVYVLRRT